MSKIAVTVDGKLVEVNAGATVGDLAKRARLGSNEQLLRVGGDANVQQRAHEEVEPDAKYRSVPRTVKGAGE